MLHRVYKQDGAKYHQLILPIEFRAQAMELLHDQQAHQAVECTLQLVCERFYWSTLLQDITRWVKNCKWCQTPNGLYVDPDPAQGSIVANNPMDLLCIDFMKVYLSKYGKENVLVMTDSFSRFSMAIVMHKQQAKRVAKALVDKWFYALVDKWFYVYGIPTRIHSYWGKSFDNKIIEQLCKIYGVKQSTTTPYNPPANSPCERLNHTLQNLLKTLPKDHKHNWPAHLSVLVFVYNATPPFHHWVPTISGNVWMQGSNTLQQLVGVVKVWKCRFLILFATNYEVELCSRSLKTEPILSLSTSFRQLI